MGAEDEVVLDAESKTKDGEEIVIMMRTEAEALRDLAAEPTRARIEEDRRRASNPVTPLVDYIAAHLFERTLSYERMRRDLDIRDNNRSTVFRQDLGLTPAAYIRELRFEIACRLLRDTQLDVATVGDLVGYRGPNVFGAAFRRWAGLTPARYRRQERRVEAESGLAFAGERPDFSPAAWRRFVEGELPDGDADLLLRYLLDRYPKSRGRLVRELLRAAQIDQTGADTEDEKTAIAPSLRSLFAREDIEQLMAEVVWEDVREKPWPELHDLVRHHLRFTTPAFVHLLGEKSREEGREDRARGIEIARLAIAAAEAFEGDGADTGGQGPLKALAWAWLGNAKRLALDFLGADDAFRAAQQRLPRGYEREAGTVLSMLAALRNWQRRYDEALESASAAVSLLRSVGDTEALARTYVLRGAIQRHRESYEAATKDYEAATQLLAPEHDRDLYFATRFNLARCLVEIDAEGAAAAVAAVRKLTDPSSRHFHRVVWLEGLLAAARRQWRVARERLQDAKSGLGEAQDSTAVALLSLDFAMISLQSGNPAEARAFVEEALPVFEALAFRSETVAAESIREDARHLTERVAEMLDAGLTVRTLRALRQATERLWIE